MILTSSRYAIRALVELATLPEEGLMLGRDISEKTQIPKNFLSKILLTLGRAGFVHATRGFSGGYRLAKHPKDISLIHVIELFEGPRNRSNCLLDIRNECSSESPCRIHKEFASVRDTFVRFLEKTTIADISAGPSEENHVGGYVQVEVFRS